MNNIQKMIFTSLVAISVSAITVPTTVLAIGLVPFSTATEVDNVKINTAGFDLAGPGLSAGAALTPARIVWKQTSVGATNKLEGSLYLQNVVNNCAKVELISYDSDSVEIPPRAYSADACVGTNDFEEFFISVQGNQGASEVKVRLLTALNVINPIWGSVAARSKTYGPVFSETEISISAIEVDLGTGPFVGRTATDPATMTWTVGENNEITPTADGTLYMFRSDNLCGRLRYTYLSQDPFGFDTELETRYGTEHCVTNGQLHTFTVHTGGYANVAVNKVEIGAQTSPNGSGNWTERGSVTTILPTVAVPVWP